MDVLRKEVPLLLILCSGEILAHWYVQEPYIFLSHYFFLWMMMIRMRCHPIPQNPKTWPRRAQQFTKVVRHRWGGGGVIIMSHRISSDFMLCLLCLAIHTASEKFTLLAALFRSVLLLNPQNGLLSTEMRLLRISRCGKQIISILSGILCEWTWISKTLQYWRLQKCIWY